MDTHLLMDGQSLDPSTQRRPTKYQLLSQTIDDSFSLKERFINKPTADDEQQLINSILVNEPIQKHHRILHSKLIKLFYVLIAIAFIFFIVFVFNFERPLLKSFNLLSFYIKNKLTDVDKNDWSFSIDSYGTESCIRVYDIDQDGLDDFIFGLVGVEELNSIGTNSTKNEGLLMGVKGLNGQILWNVTTKSEIFELNCQIDIDQDGRLDCLGSGRKNTLIGFDPHNGNLFWDTSFNLSLNTNWNFYNPVILPYDFDLDGVNEFLISTGGNPTIPSDVHERESGRVLLFSGKTGTQIGKDLVLPQDKETYMSPVLHSIKNSYYILLGTGGETVPGNLYVQSLPDFYSYVAGLDFEFDGIYDLDLTGFTEDQTIQGLYSVYESSSKGVMVPPVMADVTKDGVKDILVLSFDGAVFMLNGENFEILWSKKFDCYETYTSPAPGYFDNDDVLDFILVQNLGTFDYYLNSSVLVLSGLDGSILWQMNLGRMQMISPLTVQTDSKHRDLFFFRAQGVEYLGDSMHQVYHGIEPQQPIDKSPNNRKRELGEFERCQSLVKRNGSSQSLEPKCGDEKNSAVLSTYGFLVDRSLQESPITVFKSEPLEAEYKLNLGNSSWNLCLVMEPMERNTGAIGHFTSEAELDVVSIITRGANVRDPRDGNYVKIVTDMKIFKTSLRNRILKNERLDQKIFDRLIVKKDKSSNEVDVSELFFLKNQTWNGYMGTNPDSSFE